jgi:hypothetical protein
MRAVHSSQDRCRTRFVLTIAHIFIRITTDRTISLLRRIGSGEAGRAYLATQGKVRMFSHFLFRVARTLEQA